MEVASLLIGVIIGALAIWLNRLRQKRVQSRKEKDQAIKALLALAHYTDNNGEIKGSNERIFSKLFESQAGQDCLDGKYVPGLFQNLGREFKESLPPEGASPGVNLVVDVSMNICEWISSVRNSSKKE